MTEYQRSDAVGLLLVGHGTRDLAGLAEFWQLVHLTRSFLPGMPVEGCLLELAEPSIPEGLRVLAARGARRVLAMPLMLLAAGHAKRDIPQALAAAGANHPGLRIEQLPHFGCQPAVVELSERRFQQAASDCKQVGNGLPDERPRLVLAGRGSNDPEATAEMHRFAECRARLSPQRRWDIGFIAMAEPRVDVVLRAAAEAGTSQLVVQPHLLFSGLLLAQLKATIDEVSRVHPAAENWRVADPLGPDPVLAEAIARMAVEKLGQNVASGEEPNPSRLR